MRVNITSKGFTANDRQVALIEKKFGKLSKFFPDDVAASVTMGYKKNRQTMEAMIPVKGMIFRAEFTDSDMNVCLDKVVERLTSQITRHKKKLQKTNQKIKGDDLRFDVVPEIEEAETDMTPVRVKEFEITSMEIEEAILQMEMLDHNFFVFMNAETGRASIVYRRGDDTYGLLNPIY